MANSATITYILGLPVQPSDTTQLADGTVLTYDKQTRSFSFEPGGGGGSGVSSLNALTGGLTIAGGTDISVSAGGSTITIAFTGSTGSGTVTSVGLSVPAEFSVSGSPVTTSGTLAISKANESANTVWAGPTSGGASQPTFRALVAADLPAGFTSVGNEVPSGTINSSNVTFTLANSPNPSAMLMLFLNGLIQKQGTDYTLSGATITYTTAPSTGDTHVAFYFK